MKTQGALLAIAVLIATAAVPTGRDGSLHFGLSSSTPAADASVPSPEEIRLVFTQVPQESSVAVRLIDPAGDAVQTGDPAYDDEDRHVIHVAVEGRLPAGAYTVAWRGIGDDGHVVRGDFAFSVTAQ